MLCKYDGISELTLWRSVVAQFQQRIFVQAILKWLYVTDAANTLWRMDMYDPEKCFVDWAQIVVLYNFKMEKVLPSPLFSLKHPLVFSHRCVFSGIVGPSSAHQKSGIH